LPEFAVFIPVLDEAGLLRPHCLRLLEFLATISPDFELIIASNGSTDATPALGADLAAREPRLRFFHLDQRGPGRALVRALDLISAPKLITLDLDLSTDLEFVGQALELLESHAVVVGSKQQGRQERVWWRVLGSGAYILCARLFLGLPYHDYSLGAKGFRTEWLRVNRQAIDWNTAYVANLLYCAHRQGQAVSEAPVVCHDTRPSRFRLLHEGFYRFAWLGRLWWRCHLRGRPVRGGLERSSH